jgi:hypothetical protein
VNDARRRPGGGKLMAHSLLTQIQDALWPRGQAGYYKVWTVLDGARDQRIYSALVGCYLNNCCLYSGDLPSAIKLTAPYLIELDREDRFTRYIINRGWGNNWGIFFRAHEGMEKIRRHLRGFLVVKDEHGKRLIFRYYDPRVLRVYLPTCLTRELQTVFGPIDRFLVEGKDPTTLIRFDFDGMALSQKTIELQASSVR